MTAADKKKIISNLPFLIFFWIFDKLSYAVRLSEENILISVVKGVSELTKAPLLSFHFTDISIGTIGALAVKGILYLRSKNAKKFRKGIEYGSARWGTPEDIKPYIDEDFYQQYAPLTKDHLLGTDDQGMDVFVRLMYGGRISLFIGFIVVILETLIGVILGGIAGYFGGWVDQVIMRIVDIFNCIPTLPILLIASAVIESWNVPSDTRIYLLMAIITLFSWSGVARLVRGQILSLREQEYITATKVMGLPTWRKIFLHLIPNVMPQLIVSMTLGLGSVILYESTLSYLGLGVQLPKAAWGTMIAKSNIPEVMQYHPNVWLPAGILIVIAVLGFNFVGDGLRDAMDPKSKK